MNDRFSSMLGIAKKAGKLVSGELACENAVKSGKAFLVVVASDASANTKKLFKNKCKYYGVPLLEGLSKERLGKAIGHEYRASAAILDKGIAQAVEKINEEREDAYEGL